MSEAAIRTHKQKQTKEDEHKVRKWIFRIIFILLLLTLAIMISHQVGLFKYPWEKQPARPVVAGDLFPGGGDAQGGHLSNMTPEEIKAQMQRVADASQFSFKINARPVFADGKSEGNLLIENPSYNVYPIVVQIFLNDTNELIYDSGGMLPDQHIDSARLLRALDSGTYAATAVFNAYDPDTGIWKGKTQAALIITVQR